MNAEQPHIPVTPVPPTPKKKWYQKLWGKVLGAVAVVGTCGIILEIVLSGVNWYNHQKEMLSKIPMIENAIVDILNEDKQKDDKIEMLENFIIDKKKSHAVGFRIFKEWDEDEKKWIKTKMYRDWDGTWNEVHIDNQMSLMYGVDYYYYISKNKNTLGEKIYCF